MQEPKSTFTLQNWLAFYAIRGMGLLPIRLVSAIGAFLGRREAKKAIKANRLWVQRLHKNFSHYFGLHDVKQREQRIVQHVSRIGRVYAEFTVQQKLVQQGHITLVGAEHLATIKQPVIILSAHTSNWELIGSVLQALQRETCDLYTPPPSPARHQFALEARRCWGVPSRLVLASSPMAMRDISKGLEEGCNVVLLVDEEADGYIRAPHLGRSHLPYLGNRWLAARLAVKHKVNILPVHVETVAPTYYRVIVDPVITPPNPSEGSEKSRAMQLADTLADKVEAWVRPQLDDWYWLQLFDSDQSPPPSRITKHD